MPAVTLCGWRLAVAGAVAGASRLASAGVRTGPRGIVASASSSGGAALQIEQFPCLSDNYGYLLHDPASGLTAAVDTIVDMKGASRGSDSFFLSSLDFFIF